MAALFSAVSVPPSTATIDSVISSVLWRSSQVTSHWSWSLFHSKKRNSSPSFFQTSAGNGGRVSQFGALIWEGVYGSRPRSAVALRALFTLPH